MPPTDTSAIRRSISLAGIDQLTLFGTQDQNLKLVEKLSGAQLVARGGELRLSGEAEAVARSAARLEDLVELIQTGSGFDVGDIRRYWDELETGAADSLTRMEAGKVLIRGAYDKPGDRVTAECRLGPAPIGEHSSGLANDRQ